MSENSSVRTTEKLLEKPIDKPTVMVESNNFAEGVRGFEGGQPPAWLGTFLKWILPVAFLLIATFVLLPSFLQRWLWMRELNFAGIFWTLFSIKLGMTCIAFLAALIFLGINIREAARHSSAEPSSKRSAIEIRGVAVNHHLLTRSLVFITVAIAAIFAIGFYTQWDTYFRFRYGGSYGLSDPIFGMDLGFYIFPSPLLRAPSGERSIPNRACYRSHRLPVRLFSTVLVPGWLKKVKLEGNVIPHVSFLLLLLAATFRMGLLSGSLPTPLLNHRRGLPELVIQRLTQPCRLFGE